MLKALQIKLFSFFCAPFLSLFMRIHNLCLKPLSCLVSGMQQVGLNITQPSSRFSLGPKSLILLLCPWPRTIPAFPGPALILVPVPLSDSGQLVLPCGFPPHPCKHRNAHNGWFQQMAIMIGGSYAIFCC